MSTDKSELLQEDALAAMPRAQLQKLGKLHNIKGNLKSTVIVAELIQKFPNGVPSPHKSPSKKASNRKSTGKSKVDIVQEADIAADKSVIVTPEERERTAATLSTKPTQNNPPAVDPHSELDATPARSAGGGDLRTPEQATSGSSRRLLLPESTAVVSVQHADEPQMADDAAEPLETSQAELASAIQAEPAGEEHGETDMNAEVEVISEQNSSQGGGTPSTSARSTPEPPASDATAEYAADVIRAMSASDEAMQHRIKQLRVKTGDFRHQTMHLLDVLAKEREMRDRIMTFFLYHIRNNNRWATGKRSDPDAIVTEQVREEYMRNGGRGWKDLGHFTYDEVWDGAPVCYAGTEEIAASNEDEILRLFDDDDAYAQFLEAKQSAEEGGEHSTPSASRANSPTPTTNKKRSIREISGGILPSDGTLGPDDVSDVQRYAPRRRVDRASEDNDDVSEAPSGTSVNKGKRRMTPDEVAKLELEQKRDHELARRALDAAENDERERLAQAHAEELQRNWAGLGSPTVKELQLFKDMFIATAKAAKDFVNDGRLKDPVQSEEIRTTLLEGFEKIQHLGIDMATVVSLPLPELAEYVLTSLPI